jgi:predicted RNase H-like HicB family nuclease
LLNISLNKRLKGYLRVFLMNLVGFEIEIINQFNIILERDGDWLTKFCQEEPSANGMGKTQEECKENLADAIRLILLDRYEDSVRGLEDNYVNELITVS